MTEQPAIDVPWETNFRDRMATAREAQGLTQTELAARLSSDQGLSFHQQTIQKIENGKRGIRLDEAFLIADELGLDLIEMTTSKRGRSAAYHRVVAAMQREARIASTNLQQDVMLELVNRLEEAVTVWHGDGDDDPEEAPTPLQKSVLGAWMIRTFVAYSHLAEALRDLSFISDRPNGWESWTVDFPHFSLPQEIFEDDALIWDELPIEQRPVNLAVKSQDRLLEQHTERYFGLNFRY